MRRAMQTTAVSLLQRVMRFFVAVDSEKLQLAAAQHADLHYLFCPAFTYLLRIDTRCRNSFMHLRR